MNALLPRNSQNARSVGVNAFERFLETESVSLDYVYACLANDTTGTSFAAVIDKFAMYLAFNENTNGKRLARSAVVSYFRQVKSWLMEMRPQCLPLIEDRVLKMGAYPRQVLP